MPNLSQGLDKSDLTLIDRGFPSANLLWELDKTTNFLVRIGSKWKPTVIERLGVGDYLVAIEVKIPVGQPKPRSGSSVRKGRKPKYEKVQLLLRMLVYSCDNKRTIRLLTNMMDPNITALEIAKLYHERWEIELTIDEIKNHFSVCFHGSPDLCVRSKDPVGVRQELYAMFAMFNHTRNTIAEAARQYKLKPLDISFTKALNAIRRILPMLIILPRQERRVALNELYREIATDCRLRGRRARHYPRKVKIKMSDFQCKKSSDHQTIIDFVEQTHMVDPAPELALSP